MVSDINISSKEQEQGIVQLNTAIEEMDSMTQQNSSLVEETASASEEMANQAQELIEMTSRFTVSGSRDDRGKQVGRYFSKERDKKKKGFSGGTGAEKEKKTGPGSNIDDVMSKEGFEEF